MSQDEAAAPAARSPEAPPPGGADHAQAPMKRVALASCVGTTIEFYDFFIYGTAAALVFPKVFFPALGAAAGTVASFATFAVAFVARPLGAIIFGHFGDRIGRKRTLISTLLLMGIATVLIGLLPGAATIGVAAPILLVALRFAQGFAVGGEWAGATLLTAEYAPPGQRGKYALFPQLGPAIAFFLSSGTFLLSGLVLGYDNETFLDYGWRIPFIVSILLVAVGLYVRLAIEETPVFKQAQQTKAPAAATQAPFVEAIRVQYREILLGAGASTLFFAFFYMGTAFLTSYGTSPTGANLSRPLVLGLGMISSVFFAAAIILASIYSDRFGRRKVIMLSTGIAVPWALVLFPVLDIGTAAAFGVGLTITLVIFGISYGPLGAFLPELFQTRYRYTGAGLAYNIAGVLGGAIPPLVAGPLASSFGSIAIGVMLAVIAVFSFVCTKVLAETRGSTLNA
ncbi:MFS transporter [Pseudonocardia bannensis]|uniref:MHS family MFS transporter n=1 Tax=Pseudonocardia bannensis TaxID=630973 RepID=A0A848DLN5_9PSEU|nr:MFS transporter [Pseudonocardia bannensis]NMH93351.1 MHS family MFS transporter [Pseudonocardia bannensis]